MRSLGLLTGICLILWAGAAVGDQFCAEDDCTGTLVQGCYGQYYIPCAATHTIAQCDPDERCLAAYFHMDDIDEDLDCDDIGAAYAYLVDNQYCTEQLISTGAICFEECNGSRVVWPGSSCSCQEKPDGCKYGKVHIMFRVYDDNGNILVETEPDNADDICTLWSADRPVPTTASTWGLIKTLY